MASAGTESALPRSLLARLGAARLVLQEAVGSSTHSAVSALQRDALLDLLGKCSLSAEGRATLGEEVVKLPWAGTDVSAVLSAVTGSNGSKVPKRRRIAQSYQSILNYLTSDEWQILLEQNPSDVKLHVLLGAAIGLGLRCPSEPCLKFLAAAWMCLDKDEASLKRLPCTQKHVLFQHVKAEFKRLTYKIADPHEHLDRLPESPVSCLRDHRLLYLAHFQQPREPVDCKVDVQLVVAFDQTFSCRNHGSTGKVLASLSAQGSPASCIASAPANLEVASMERVASMFMDRLDTLQQSQQQMLQMCVSAIGGGQNLGQNSLSALLDTPPVARRLALKRLPTVSLAGVPESEGSQLALTHGGEQPAPAPTPAEQQPTPQLAPAPPPAAQQPTPPSQQAPAPIATPGLKQNQEQANDAGQAEPTPSQLLDMYLERGLEKKECASAKAKAKAKAARAAGAQADVEVSAVSAKAKGQAKASAAPPSKVRFDLPRFRVERTRQQVMCRTGFRGPGESLALQFGEGKRFKSEQAAVKEAKRWLTEERAKQGL